MNARILVCLISCCATAQSARAELELGRILRSPAAGHGTASYIYRDITVQGGGMVSWLKVELDYFVDSEPVNDRLLVQYSTNGGASYSTAATYSGRASDRVTLSLPAGFPNVRIRFGYSKNTSVSTGLDTAYVDNILVKSSRGVIERWDFDDTFPGTVPSGWGASGSSGGWRAQRHPATRAFGPPDAMAPLSTSFMEKTFNFPSAVNNHCVASYVLDAGSTDWFRVWEGATKLFEVSGANKGGRAVFDVPAAAGNHTLRFQYSRGPWAAAGLDLLRVRGVTCWSGGEIIAYDSGDGSALGSLPVGWSGTWRVQPATPHRSYAPLQVLAGGPIVDGKIGTTEYAPPASPPPAGRSPNNLTISVTPDFSSPLARQGRFALFAQDDPSAKYLYLVGRVQADTTGAKGSESGQLAIYYDSGRTATLSRTGCMLSFTQKPDVNDRNVSFSYSLAAGVQSQTISTFAQLKGTCAASGWAPLGASAPLPVQAAVMDDGGDMISFEIRIELGAAVIAEGKLGIGVVRKNAAGTLTRETFPYSDALPPGSDDAYTWETIYLASPAGGGAKTEGFDACCVAEHDRI